jgi:hypothetical protein
MRANPRPPRIKHRHSVPARVATARSPSSDKYPSSSDIVTGECELTPVILPERRFVSVRDDES